MESLAVIFRTQDELERDDSQALRSTATCRAVLHNHVAEVRHSMPKTTDVVASFDADIAIVEPVQT